MLYIPVSRVLWNPNEGGRDCRGYISWSGSKSAPKHYSHRSTLCGAMGVSSSSLCFYHNCTSLIKIYKFVEFRQQWDEYLNCFTPLLIWPRYSDLKKTASEGRFFLNFEPRLRKRQNGDPSLAVLRRRCTHGVLCLQTRWVCVDSISRQNAPFEYKLDNFMNQFLWTTRVIGL